MKRYICWLSLCLTLCLLWSVKAQALLRPGTEDTEPAVLCAEDAGRSDPRWPYTKELIVLEEDEPLDVSCLPSGMFYTDADGGSHGVEVEWNVSDEALSQPGLHQVTAAPIPEKLAQRNLTLAEGYDGTVTWPVFRKGGQEPLPVTPMEATYMEIPLLALGGDPSGLDIRTHGRHFGVGEDGTLSSDDETWSWQWDFSGVDPFTEGDYLITGTVTAPHWIALPEDYTPSFRVHVIPADRVTLSAPIETNRMGQLIFRWLCDFRDVTEGVLERRTANGLWEPCDPLWYNTFEHSLNLSLLLMPAGETYTLRLRYPDAASGEPAERATDPITLTIPENIQELLTQANGRIPDELDFGGDRDGGDSGGTDLPILSQPAPKPDRKPVSKPEPEESEAATVMEIVTDTYTAISGLRLRQLTGLGATVLFEKQGAAMEIPSALLNALQLEDDQLLEVTIQRPQENAVQLEVLANGSPVEDLTGAVIRIPWTEESGTALQAQSLDGTVADAVWEAHSGTVCFSITAPGTWLITARPEPQSPAQAPAEPEPTQPPSAPETPEMPEMPETPEIQEPPAEAPEAALPEIPEVPEAPEQALPEEPPAAVSQEAPPVPSEPERPFPWWWLLLLIPLPLAALWRRWRHG